MPEAECGAREGKPYSILVVCTGNICRSAMAHYVLEQELARAGIEGVRVDSAGVSSEEQGNPVDYRARRVLEGAGYRVGRHRARRVRDGELPEHDLVLAMTTRHLRRLRDIAAADGGVAKGTLRYWREFDSTAPVAPQGALPGELNTELDVPDPWYGPDSGFLETLDVVEHGTRGIIEHLRGLGY